MTDTALDKMIGWLAPIWAQRRLEARLRSGLLAEARMSYDGLKSDNRIRRRRAKATDVTAEVSAAASRLRDIAREMVRNNPHASRAVQVISEGIVGAGIIPNVESVDARFKADVEMLVKRHCDTSAIDANGLNNLYGLQTLVAATVTQSGSALIRRRPRFPTDGLALPFQLQVLEPDFLNRWVSGPLQNGNYAVDGIEFNALGARVAYHLFREHPGSRRTWNGFATTRVPAEDIAHVFRVDRPGQVDGVTWFAPVFMAMNDFADYEDAQLVRQKVAACFAVFITSDAEVQNVLAGTKSPETGNPLEAVEPGMIERLRAGESVSFGSPPMVEGYRDYSVVTLQKIAVGLGVDYASLTGDNSQSNFANSRMGWLRYNRSLENWQWNMMIPMMCDPVGRWIIDAASAVVGRRPPARVLWTPPRREMLDPTKETRASIEAIQGGLTSRSAEVRQRGFDPADLDAEIAADNARADAANLKFTSDGRFAVKTKEARDDQQTD